jgi:hypothetical protein
MVWWQVVTEWCCVQMRIREELRPEQERASELLQTLVKQMEVRDTGMCDVPTCRV